SLSKIYPGYTVQKEMGKSELRERLGLPSVYFNVAILDALGDIKSQWTRTKASVLKRVNKNENFSETDRHYLRFLLKVSNAFEMVLNDKTIDLKPEVQKKYAELAERVDTHKLNSYLKRQVRKLHTKQYAEKAEGFSLTERAYRYDNHGIYITMKEKRKRIFVELTDHQAYMRQIYIKLYPEQNNIELLVPVDVKVKQHTDYYNSVGLAVGMYTMFVTDKGNTYGEQLGEYQIQLAEWVREQSIKYALNRHTHPGRKKYTAKKRKMTEQLHSYINMELNRFLKIEKPEVIYIPKLPKAQKRKGNKAINHSVTMWQRGYIRFRLQQKCKEQSIELVEVFGKDISNACSRCGGIGKKQNGIFTCSECGNSMDEKINAACNAKKRGERAGFEF
uniref:zinc ribbon domain-containing protein n=1 Tax=Agathobacter sp. TaxID=2021311 RepID=UPI004055C370